MMKVTQVHTVEIQMDNVNQTVANVTAVSSTILAANPERKYLRFRSQGTGTAAVYIKLAAVAATTTNADEILDAEEWTLPFAYTGEVRAITSSGSKTVSIQEWY